jgi:transcriptional regulator NrdR family protein
MTVDNQFNNINEKLQLLLKQHQRLKKENERLRGELEAQKQKDQVAQQTIQELHQHMDILKLASGDMSEKDKKEFERKINQYVKEIDKCIAFLSQ